MLGQVATEEATSTQPRSEAPAEQSMHLLSTPRAAEVLVPEGRAARSSMVQEAG